MRKAFRNWTAVCLFVIGVFAAGMTALPAQGFENNTDRPGSDISNFDLPRPSPELCRSACDKNSACQAWTYVKPGVQGPSARCWLKNPVPGAVRSDCCVSGLKERGGRNARPGMEERGGRQSMAGMEQNTDRPGSDISDFDLSRPSPELCRSACDKNSACQAWTYVKPGVQGPSARCWLKNPVPGAVRSDCCVSGVKEKAGRYPRGRMEQNTDRPGSDISDFDLQRPSPELCRNACEKNRSCQAWTYVKPGVQGPSARCWLKNPVPDAVHSDCCVSGVK